ncbi:MAG: C25 family cysteine peptidase [Methermicoccaceae archaeon]
MKKTWGGVVYLLVIIMFLLPANTVQNRASTEKTGFIEVKLEAGNYTIKQTEAYSKITMDGFNHILTPGCPMLPSKTYLVGLPPGAEVTSVDLVKSLHQIIPGNHRVMLAPPLMDEKGNQKTRVFKDPYPSSTYDYLGTGQIRKYRFARIRFFPITYFSATGKLILHESITLKIGYRVTEKVSNQILADTVMDEFASKNIVNHPYIVPLYKPKTSSSLNISTYDYVIITKNSLKDAVKPLVNWKKSLGYNVKIVTNYTNPEEIRSFLKNKYVEWGIKYVLIVGSTHIIPMRRCYPKPNDPDKATPTDYYYADLTGYWNSDYDDYYGERGEDDVDFYPEVYVGRIPLDDPLTVKNVCQKIVEFESQPWEWKKKALLLGAIINYENEDGEEQPETDGANGMEECRNDIFIPNGYICTTMYEKNGLKPSQHNCDYPLTHENVLTEWKKGYGIVNWWAHGTLRASSRKVWENDDGDSVPERDEISWPKFIESRDVSDINDEKPSVVFSCSCDTAWPEEEGSLGNSLMKTGAVAFIGAARTSWSTVGWEDETDGGNMAINYFFFRNLLTHHQGVGEALYNSKINYFTSFNWWGWMIYQDMYGFNLYGEPSMVLELPNYPPSSPSNPYPADDVTSVDPNVTLSWMECMDPEGDKVYYDVYLKEDEEPDEQDLIAHDLTEPNYDVKLNENTHYFWKVVAKDEKGLWREGPIWEFYTIDTMPPTIEIMTPKKGYLYVSGSEKRQTLLGKTIILGWVEVKVHAEDNMGLEKVVFYVDEQLKHTCHVLPYQWRWDETIFGRHSLKIVAYDHAGNIATDEIKIIIFNISI